MILVAVFLAVLLVAFTIVNSMANRRQVARNVERAAEQRSAAKSDKLNDMLGSESDYIQNYFEVMSEGNKESVKARLIRAGYFNRSALTYFNLVRMAAAFVAFVAAFLITLIVVPGASNAAGFLLAMIAAALAFFMCSMFLERMGKNNEIKYRKLFPDFMDLLIVCVDAGLSIEAAVDRVAREFLLTNPDFGTHLAILGLEVRAGRPMHEALANLATRINVEEARQLAVLFRQSEELGSSVSKALRTFSTEMRQMRIIRAEEKANALPVKMLFPLAAFLFPVNLVIVLVPILITIVQMFQSMSPPG